MLAVALAAGCAAHDAGAVSRGHGAFDERAGGARGAGAREAEGRPSGIDRSGDGWQRVGEPGAMTQKLGATGSGAPATAPKKAQPKSTPAPVKKTAAKPATPAKKQDAKVAMVTPQKKAAAQPDFGAKAVANGRAILAGTAAKPKRQDCSGFVTTIYERAGQPLEISAESQKGTKSMAEMLYRTAKAEGRTHKGKPKVGDLVFYENTFGALDGRITHVAVVESIQDDGTVMVIHNIGGRYRKSPMNLEQPHEPLKNGYFRKKQSANEPVLAGELFVAYARPG